MRALPTEPRPLRWWAVAGAMLGLALVAYLPAALRAGFLNFDDNLFFGPDNPEFREGLLAVLDPSRPIANAWLPVAHLSLWLDWKLGLWTHAQFDWRPQFVPHFTAILWHAAAACVLVRLVEALRAPRWLALATGAAFAVHPALAESVAWASGRKDVLSGLFVFAALLQTVRCADDPGPRRLAAIGAFGVLALYAKATAVVLPLLALLCCFATRGSRRRFLAPFVLLLVAVPIAWHHQSIAAAEGTLAGGATGERLAQVPGAFWHYLGTAFWPLQLNVLYPEVDTLQLFRERLVPGLAALLLALVGAALAWRNPRWRLAAVGAVGFAIALLPFNTAFPASAIAAADRYLYLAVPGAALAAFAALGSLLPRAAPAIAAGLLLPMLWLCASRAHDFVDSETLWRSSLAAAPQNAVAHLNLANELLRRRSVDFAALTEHADAAIAAARYPIHELRARELATRLALAAVDYTTAAAHARGAIDAAERLVLSVAPRDRGQAEYLLLGACLKAFEPLRQAGDSAGAAAAWARARELAPEHPDVVAFAQVRELGEALGDPPQPLADDDPRGAAADRALADACARWPDHAGLWCAQASWDQARGRVLPALRNYRRAQAADESCIDAWLGAARLLRSTGNHADAEGYARKGLEQRPDPALRQELALALVGQGRLDDAILHLEACLRLRPDDQGVARVLANVLVGRAYVLLSGDADRAEVLRTVQRALHWNPGETKAHLVLGRLAREQRDFAAAVRHFETAYRLLPDFAEARTYLAECLADLGYERVLAKDDERAGSAFRRCLDVAPDDFDTGGVRLQLEAIWRRCEARGVDCLRDGDLAGAEAAFRRCLELDPEQHWAAWLLATTVQQRPDPDLAELESLCRLAVAWQERHGLDRSQQVWLLAATLARADMREAAREVAIDYLREAGSDGVPQAIAALRQLAWN